jgi:hypothetical protein
MSSRRLRCVLVDQRGIALPLALIVLTLLTSMTLAFLAMGATEPVISANLKGGERALALAEAGIERAIWALINPTASGLTNLNEIPGSYSGQTLFSLTPAGQASAAGAFTVSLTGAGPILITSHGYIVRDGVALPGHPAQLTQSDIAAQRVVRVQVTAGGGGGGGNDTVGGAASPGNVTLPGALTVAGSLQMAGSSFIDGKDRAPGTPNGCSSKFGVTIRDKTTLPDGTTVNNSITTSGASSIVGSPTGTQTLTGNNFNQYLFTADHLAALKALAQSEGTYIKPPSNAQFDLTVVNGLMFVDTVDGQLLGTPPDASKLASVKITGMNNSGWLIVMGSVRIDGNVQYGGTTYNGFIYAHNDISYKGSGTGGIYGAMLTGNVVDSVSTVVDSDTAGNANVYYDCAAVATGGGGLTQSILDALNRRLITINNGTWREVSN